MANSFEDEHLDVLQNIEFGIVRVYHAHPDLLDSHVNNVLEALIRIYGAQEQGRDKPSLRLTDLEQELLESIKQMCDWRLGDLEPDDPLPGGEQLAELHPDPITFHEIIACLKRIRLSVKRWTKQGGRQGYLDFVSQYIV